MTQENSLVSFFVTASKKQLSNTIDQFCSLKSNYLEPQGKQQLNIYIEWKKPPELNTNARCRGVYLQLHLVNLKAGVTS